ncbi:MAG: TonB-dependent receptor [Opitutaceae bacterium]
MKHSRPATRAIAAILLFPALAAAQIATLDPLTVTASRAPQSSAQVPFAAVSFSEEALAAIPTVTLDGALRSVPGFSLFRRSDSLTANPTAQGVSLRGLGPSGASRSLVLLDGVPLNDPFGGWVAWTKVPHDGLERAELLPGGGATSWGNAALGGIVQLFTAPTQSELAHGDASPAAPSPNAVMGSNRQTGRATATFGDFGTRSLELVATQPVGRGVVQLLGRSFTTDGFSLIAPERRGTIDVNAWSRHRWLMLRWQQPLGDKLEFTATARGYEESRGNGTPYQRNGSREKFASFEVAGEPAENFAWNAVAYGQDQSFASTFSGVNATRTAETPASDQFAVPATAFGATWTGAWSHHNGARTSVGADARYVRGETREHFTFVAGNFARLRVAGGRQSIGGVFAQHEQPLATDLRVTIGARVDSWKETDGHRRESDRASGNVSRADRYSDRDGVEFSPSAGLVWQPASSWRLRSAAQQAFRRPTLNELYRPFRQGANVTEANAALKTERVTSAEFGFDWMPLGAGASGGQVLPGSSRNEKNAPLTLGLTAFWNDLHDAVGNVTIARGPGTFPIVGTLAAGGIGRQRLNLDRVRVRGIELSATVQTNRAMSWNAALLLNDATVRRASVAPGLAGKELAQVPRHTASVGGRWLVPGGITLAPRLRWIGRQFEDDENTLLLGEVIVADLGASRALTKHLELFLTLENLGDVRIETGRSADGVVNTGTPRLFIGGVRGRW